MSVLPVTPPRSARHAVFHELRVSAVDPLTDDAVALTFEVPSELRDEYRHVQGQHVSVRCSACGDDLRRSYSVCTAAGSGVLRIGVRRLPGGAFSGHAMERLRPGDAVEVMTPVGGFHVPLEPDRARRHVAIAAGSGVTPILSIAATTLAVETRSEVILVLANRSSASVMFLEELGDLKDRHPTRFSLYHVLSREAQESELLSGRLDASRLGRLLDLLLPAGPVDAWLLCGPEPMIATCRAVLAERGVDPERIHSELFHVEGSLPRRPAAAAPEVRAGEIAASGPGATLGGGGSRVTLILDGRETGLQVPADGEVILDAALRVRPDAPYSCRDGVCGTCRARVVQGQVRMDRCHALESGEVEAGFVLTCQAHPVSEAVTLDYDA
jgi:ring-1,2-phenylacetyl-CoA epoxidase subunit PaaE